MTSFEDAELELIANVVASWPLENKFPGKTYSSIMHILLTLSLSLSSVLDVLRRLILHPAAAKYYSKHYKSDSSKGNVIATCNQLLGDSTANLGCALMTLRFFANLFQFLEGREIALSPAVSLWVCSTFFFSLKYHDETKLDLLNIIRYCLACRTS